MSHLSQIIAVEKEAKAKATSQFTTARQVFTNKGVLSGISRSYTPKDEDGEQLPPESTRVQTTVKKTLEGVKKTLESVFDLTATKDYTNCVAKADIIVDEAVFLENVPATYILFLEKQLAELAGFVKTIPTLDPADEWHYDAAQDAWASSPVETMRNKKTMHNHVLAAATDKHPAQVQVYADDIPVGRWKTIKYSGAIPAADLNAMIERIEKLQRAVRFAREEANRKEAVQQRVGDALLRYILG